MATIRSANAVAKHLTRMNRQGRCEHQHTRGRMVRIGSPGVACIKAPPFADGPDYAPDSFREMILATDQFVERGLAGPEQP